MANFVSVILPCRNEERTIGECIRKAKKALNDNGIEGEIIISDSSHDDSAGIAKRLGVKVVRHSKEGYGYAYHEGIKAAKGSIIIMGDADNTYDFSEIPKLISKCQNNDIVIGSRFKGKITKGAMPWLHQYIGNPALSFLLRLFFGIKVKDTQSGFRLVKKEAWKKLNLQTNGMEFASEMLIKAAILRMKIAEVPITYYPREVGSESKLRSFRDGWKHLRFMLLYSNSLVFLIPGSIFLLAGILSFIFYRNLLPLTYIASFLTIVGYQIILLGLFAKVYASVHLKTGSRFVDFVNRHISLEKAIFASLLLIALSHASLYFTKNLVIFMTLVIIGIQSFFGALFLSIIGIEEK